MCGGLWMAAIVLVALLAALPWSKTLVSDAEREVISKLAGEIRSKAGEVVLRNFGANRAQRPSHEVAASLSRGRQPTEA
jgi:hypothetical protein